MAKNLTLTGKKKKKNEFDLQSSVKAITGTVNKVAPKKDNKTVSTTQKPQNNLLNKNSNIKEMPTFKSKDTRTIKTNQQPKKKSIQTYDVYERGGKYFYEENGKEVPIKTKYLKNAIKNNQSGVVGTFNEKGKFSETNSRGVPIKQTKEYREAKQKKQQETINRLNKVTDKTIDYLMPWRAVQKKEKEAINLAKETYKSYKKNKNDLKQGKVTKQELKDKAIVGLANSIENSPQYKNLKTTGNIMTQMGHGAARSVEGVLDFANAISNSINNPLEQKAKVGLGLRTEEEAQKERQEAERQQSNWDARNLTDEALQKLGWNEDLYKQWESGSSVRRDNMAGQIAEGIGGMVPSLVAGQALGIGNVTNASLKGLRGAELLKGIGRNVGTGILSNAGGSAVLGASAYGSGYEEALSQGATPEQARRYGVLNAGTEFATEMVTGGIPGLKQTGILDNMADGLIDKATGKVTNKFLKQATGALLKMGYTGVGEGFEEALADIINPMIKNATYTDGEHINWQDVWRDFFVGGTIGLALGGGNAAVEGVDLANQQIQELNTIADQRIQQIKQEVQQDPSRAQKATQEMQDIQNYVQAQTNIIQNQAQTQAQESDTTQPNAITQQTQSVAQNEQNEGTQESAFNNENKVKLTSEELDNFKNPVGSITEPVNIGEINLDNGEKMKLSSQEYNNGYGEYVRKITATKDNGKEAVLSFYRTGEQTDDFDYKNDRYKVDYDTYTIRHLEGAEKGDHSGTTLLNQLIKEAKENGIKQIVAYDTTHNLDGRPSKDFWEKHGFVSNGQGDHVLDLTKVKNVETNQNESTPTTKSENVISEEMTPQQEERKQPEILEEMPKDQTSAWQKLKKAFNKFRHHFTDHREAWYDASRKLKNPDLNSRADALDLARDKAQVDIGRAQVDYNSTRYKNFTDEKGNKVSMSFEGAYDLYNKIPVKDKNTFLVHQLNIDRWGQGVDQFDIPLHESYKTVGELKNKYKDIDKWSENIYQYYRNLQQKLVDSGRLSQEKVDEWRKSTPHYVHIQRHVDKASGDGVSIKGGKVDSNNLIQKVKGSTLPILPIKQTTSDFTIKSMNAIQLNNLAKEWAKTAGVGSLNNNTEEINDMDDIFGIDEKVFNDNGKGNYSILAYDKGATVEIPITKEMYEGLKPRDLRKLPTSKVTKIQRDLITNKNPVFGLITNPIKDLQAMHFYSKFSADKTAKTYMELFGGRTLGKATNNDTNKVTAQDWVNLFYDAGNAANSFYNNGEFESEKEAQKGKIRKGLSKVGEFLEKGNNFMESMPRITEFVNTIKDAGYTINKGEGPVLVAQKGKNPTKTVEQVLMEASHNAAEITVNFKRGGTWAKNFDKNFAVYSSPALQGASKFGRNITEAIGDARQGDYKAAKRLILRAIAMGLAPVVLNGVIYGDDDDYEELQDYQKDRYYLLKGEWFGLDEKWIRIPRGREISTIQSLAKRTKNAVEGKEDAFKGYGKFALDQVGPANPIDSNILAPITGAYVFNRSWSGNKIVPDALKNADAKDQYNEKTDELSKWIGKKLNISPMKVNYVLDQYSGVIGDVGLPYITARANNNTNDPVLSILQDKYTFDQANSSKNVGDFYDLKAKLKNSENEEDKLKGQLMGTKAKELFELTKEKQDIQMNKNLSKKDKYNRALKKQKEINEFAKEATKEIKEAKTNIDKYSATVGDHVYHKNKKDEWVPESEKATARREELGLTPEKYYYYHLEESYTPPNSDYASYITSGKNAKYNIAMVDAFNFDPSDYLKYKHELSQIRGDKDSRGKTIRYSARNKKLKYLNSLPISSVEKAYLMKQNDKYYKSSDNNLKKAISKSNLSKKEKEEMYSYLGLGR